MTRSRERRIVAVFGSSAITPDESAWRQAELCGRLIAEIPMAVATGGYGGAMEAVSSGAAAAGGHVVGVTAPGVFPGRHGANVHVVDELMAESITERIHKLVTISSAAIVLPGSLGTLTELTAAWNAAFVAPFSSSVAKPVIVVGDDWRSIVHHLADAIDADPTPITSAATVAEAIAALRDLLGVA